MSKRRWKHSSCSPSRAKQHAYLAYLYAASLLHADDPHPSAAYAMLQTVRFETPEARCLRGYRLPPYSLWSSLMQAGRKELLSPHALAARPIAKTCQSRRRKGAHKKAAVPEQKKQRPGQCRRSADGFDLPHRDAL